MGSWEEAMCPAHSLHSEHLRYTPMHRRGPERGFQCQFLMLPLSYNLSRFTTFLFTLIWQKIEGNKCLRSLNWYRGPDTALGRFTEPQIQWKDSHSVCLSLVTIPQGPTCECKLNRSWGQDYAGLFSDLYGLRTKRDQGERGLSRDSHPSPSQWPRGPDDSIVGQDKAFPWALHKLEHSGSLEV